MNRTCGNKPLNIDSQEVCGIGTHSEAIIRDLSNGYDTFSARGIMTNKRSPEFRVHIDQDKTDVPNISKVSFDFQALEIHGKAQARYRLDRKDLGGSSGSLSRSLPLHATELYTISPE